nr:hypothetical protein [Pseudemcibacter aquimaris]
MSYNIQLYRGPSEKIPHKALVLNLEGKLLEQSDNFSEEFKQKIPVILPPQVISQLNLNEIGNVSEFTASLIKALLNLKVDYPYDISTYDEAEGKFKLVLPYDMDDLVVRTARLSMTVLNLIFRDQQVITKTQQSQINNYVQEIVNLSPSTIIASMLKTAKEYDIPFTVIDKVNFAISYGQGVNSKIFQYASTDKDSSFGYHMQKDKISTNVFLRKLGFPASEQYIAADFNHCRKIIDEIGFPVVIKPHAEGRGTGVTANICKIEDIEPAFLEASEFSPGRVVIEKYVPGDDHRINVYEGKVVSVMRRRAAFVIGDGRSSLQTLVQIENKRRLELRAAGGRYLQQIDLDVDGTQRLIADAGLTLKSIPEEGRRVNLISMANVSRGGSAKFLDLKNVHPDNIKMAIDVARAFRLDNAGLDFITGDITKSWQEEGAIIEVNAYPFVGDNIIGLIFKEEFAKRNNGRIDTMLYLSDDENNAHSYFDEIKNKYKNLGFTNDKYTEISGMELHLRLLGLIDRINALSLNPTCDGMLVHMKPKEVKELGLPMDQFSKILVDKHLDKKLEWIENYTSKIEII